MNTPTPRIGIGVIIKKEDHVLFGLRHNSHGEGTWCCPGGHLEFAETPEQCARREVLEETVLKVGKITQGPFTNDFFEAEQKHYIIPFG